MTDPMDIDPADVLRQEERNRQALLMLLDKQRDKANHLLALEARMGRTRSLVTTASLEWVAQRVKFARDLPIFREHKDPESGNIVVDETTASIIQQRNPDFSRQLPMALYLARRSTHKFPPILVVANQDWVDDPNSDNWTSDGQALKDSVNAVPLDSQGRFVDIELEDDRDFLYAIDGQHRVMAIQGLMKLLRDGELFARDKGGKERSLSYTVDGICEQSRGRISRSDLQKLGGERIGIEIIPAVLKGESVTTARQRLRSTFVHVNKHAVPLSKGEIALLNEDDGFAVVARMLMVSHPLLRGRVNTKKSQLTERDTSFTTLEALVDIATSYLGQSATYAEWKPELKLELAVRPEEDALDGGCGELGALFDALGACASISDIVHGGECSKWRSFDEEGDGNLLFRPIGQKVIAEGFGTLVHERGMQVERVCAMLAKAEERGLLRCDRPASPWYGALYDPLKEKMQNSQGARTLGVQLLLHVLGGGTPSDEARDALRQKFAESRVIDPEKMEAHDLEGNRVSHASIELPAPW